MTWRQLLIGCAVACALTALSVLATRPAAGTEPAGSAFEATRLVRD